MSLPRRECHPALLGGGVGKAGVAGGVQGELLRVRVPLVPPLHGCTFPLGRMTFKTQDTAAGMVRVVWKGQLAKPGLDSI